MKKAYNDNINVIKVDRDKNKIATLIILTKNEWTVECTRPERRNKKFIGVRVISNEFGASLISMPPAYWMEFHDRASAIFHSDEERFKKRQEKRKRVIK